MLEVLEVLKVFEVLDMLQIGHVQHSIVGSVEKRGISGGQRKRVNIGLELVADPDVLFLDEPTSGLDSTSAEIILAALKDLSRLGRTIIMVIHQPRYSIFASMDNVIFLGPGGKTVYSGSPLDATDYFEMLGFFAPPAVNRADFFMDVIGGKICRALSSSFVLGVRHVANSKGNAIPFVLRLLVVLLLLLLPSQVPYLEQTIPISNLRICLRCGKIGLNIPCRPRFNWQTTTLTRVPTPAPSIRRYQTMNVSFVPKSSTY